MINIKFLSGWNKHLLTKSYSIDITNFQIKPQNFPKILEQTLHFFNVKDYFYGIFQVMTYSGISPFIATHDYCIKVLHYDGNGTVKINISPIYHLGLEYPEHYKSKYGKNVDQDAVIGLLEKPTTEMPAYPHTLYSYGVDAGILFKDSHVSHNKKMVLKFEIIHKNLLVTISYEKQTSSTSLSWTDIGLQETSDQDLSVLEGDWAVNN